MCISGRLPAAFWHQCWVEGSDAGCQCDADQPRAQEITNATLRGCKCQSALFLSGCMLPLSFRQAAVWVYEMSLMMSAGSNLIIMLHWQMLSSSEQLNKQRFFVSPYRYVMKSLCSILAIWTTPGTRSWSASKALKISRMKSKSSLW